MMKGLSVAAKDVDASTKDSRTRGSFAASPQKISMPRQKTPAHGDLSPRPGIFFAASRQKMSMPRQKFPAPGDLLQRSGVFSPHRGKRYRRLDKRMSPQRRRKCRSSRDLKSSVER